MKKISFLKLSIIFLNITLLSIVFCFVLNIKDTYALDNIVIDGIKYSISDSAEITEYEGENANLILPDTITYEEHEYNVTSISTSAFKDNEYIKNIEFSSNIKNIGSDAFENVNIENVYYDGDIEDWCNITFEINNESTYDKTNPASIAGKLYLKTNEKSDITFGDNYYYKLSSLTIPNTINVIGDYQFANLSISSLTLNNNITTIKSYAFYKNDFSEVILSDHLIYAGEYSFAETKISNITIYSSMASVNNYTISSSSFAGITEDAKVTYYGSISSLKKFKTINDYYCDIGNNNLFAILNSDDTSKLEIIEPSGLYNSNYELISSWNDMIENHSITLYNNIIRGLDLTSFNDQKRLVLDDAVTSINEITDDKLSEIYLGKNFDDNANIALKDFSNLSKINVSNDNDYYKSLDGVLYSKTLDTIYSYPAKKAGEYMEIDIKVTYGYEISSSTTKIKNYAFNNLSAVETLIITNVDEIEDEGLSNAKSLKNITVSSNNKTYADMNGILYSKDYKTLYKIPISYNESNEREYSLYWSTENIYYKAIEKNNYIETLILSQYVSKEKIANYAIYDSANLRKIICYNDDILDIFGTSYLNQKSDDEDTFYTYALLINNEIHYLPGLYNVTNDIYYMAYNWLYLTNNNYLTVNDNIITTNNLNTLISDTSSLVLNDNITKIGDNAFKDTKLSYILFDDNLTEISDNAFINSELKSIKLNHVSKVGNSAFKNSLVLENVTFSEYQEYINAYAFYNCNELVDVFLYENLINIEEYAFACESEKESKELSIFAKTTTDASSFNNRIFEELYVFHLDNELNLKNINYNDIYEYFIINNDNF